MFLLYCTGVANAQDSNIWSREKANDWYKNQPWIVGCNYIPSTAVNQLEMWQADTFDESVIDRELGWAEKIGFNVIRVYLHDLAWKQDKEGFKNRIDRFLKIASGHNIKVIFVFFDDCWNADPKEGKQPDPVPGRHNSGWVQSPGRATLSNPDAWKRLEKYVKDILTRFSDDKRILLWDLYNEPGNMGNAQYAMPLLKKAFEWAWDVRPSQPLSVGVWDVTMTEFNEFQASHSDVITFHNYNDTQKLKVQIEELQKYGRPIICTEYMARTNGSRFETHLPVFKKYNIGAINWGLVSGKTNTIFPWGPGDRNVVEPQVWFHDVFRKDGTPFSETETKFIKEVTGR